MSASKYIRPMTFGETLRSMFGLYWKIFIPIIIMNIIVDIFSLGVGLVAGLFVGPVLVMTSNAILGKRIKALDSIRRGIFSISFFKIALVSFGYIIFIVLLVVGLFYLLINIESNETLVYGYFFSIFFLYFFLNPVWIFIPMIMLLEKKGLRASFKRSFQILRRNLGRILQMDIFMFLVLTALGFLIFYLLLGRGMSISTPTDVYVIAILCAILGVLFASITGFSSLPYVFVYYEYRARHENYSEELLTQEMGYQPMEEMMTV